MNAKIVGTVLLTLALTAAPVQAQESEKPLRARTAETLDKAKEGVKDAGRAVSDTTKRAVEKVKDAVTPDADAREVKVRLVEHKIEMPQELPAGKTAFVVTNAGKAKHNFEIEGEGLEKKFLISLGPDQSKTLNVNLKPGKYKVYCPIADHEEHGMKVDLTVK